MIVEARRDHSKTEVELMSERCQHAKVCSSTRAPLRDTSLHNLLMMREDGKRGENIDHLAYTALSAPCFCFRFRQATLRSADLERRKGDEDRDAKRNARLPSMFNPLPLGRTVQTTSVRCSAEPQRKLLQRASHQTPSNFTI